MLASEFQIADLRVVTSSRRLIANATEVTLSPRAMSVFKVLAQANKQVVSRATLLETVWPDVIVTDESLTQAITEIRRGLTNIGADRSLIETIPKSGYRLRDQPIFDKDVSPFPNLDELTLPLDAYCVLLEAQTTLVRGDADAPIIAYECAKEAVGLAPDSSWAHATCAVMLVHAVLYSAANPENMQTASEHAERAVALSPQNSLAHAAHGFTMGAFEGGSGAYTALAKGLAHSDKSGEAHYLAARVAFVAGDYRNAANLALRSSELVPDPSRPLFLAARAAFFLDVAQASAIAKRCVRALERRLSEDSDEPRSRYTLGPALALAGEPERAWSLLSKPRFTQSICLIHDFFGYALLQDETRALDALENALDEGFRHGRWLQQEPMVTGLRTNRRFQRLAAPIAAA